MMTCKNCGSEFEGNFCNNCGQSGSVHRFTLKHAFHDFLHTFTHVDRGILFLIKQLFLKPGVVAKEYIAGKRKKYFNPFQYLILAVAVSFFLTAKLGVIGFTHVEPEIYSRLAFWQRYFLEFNNFIYTYFNLLLFIAVPLMAFYSWLFYRKSGFNYSENVIFQTFIAAQRCLLYILLMPFLYSFREKWYIGIGTYYFLFFIYYAWAYTQFFGGNKTWNFVKYFISFILSIITIQFTSMAIFYFFFFNK